MKSSETLKFLSETDLAVIACENANFMQDFIKYILIECGIHIVELDIGEINKYDLSGVEFVIVKGIRNLREQRLKIAERLQELINIAKVQDVYFIVPLEKLECAPHLVTAQLRSIYFRIAESNKPNFQIFNLHCGISELRLECEFGMGAGQYLLYDYCEHTMQLKEVL